MIRINHVGYIFAFFSGCFLAFALKSLYEWIHKNVYYSLMPKSLKDEKGNFIVNKNILAVVDDVHESLIQTAHSRYKTDRGPAFILKSKEKARYIEKFARKYYDDFTDEINDGRLDWNNENTRLFFSLMEEKFRISNRALLRTILYLRHEIDYFNYRDSLLTHAPKSRMELLKKTVVYNMTNEGEPVSKYKIKRMLCERGFGLPKVPMGQALEKARRSLENDRFDKDFIKRKTPVRESSEDRLFRTAWEDIVRVAFDKGINIDLEQYIIVEQDFREKNRIDTYFRKHLKYVLFEHFHGKCADCSSDENLQMDHFWCPKIKGGNFAMRSKAGLYVNNCIPLCGSCNAAKGAKHVYEYFEPDKVQELLEHSHKFDIFLNQKLQSFSDDNFGVDFELHLDNPTAEDKNKKAA
jgi:5-methylcytosine-specific restriction endonuclease McrA